MIQFRWRKLDEWHPAEAELAIVNVDGHPCVLEYRQYFVPSVVPGLSPDDDRYCLLKPARDVDKQWREVTIDE